MTPETLSIRRRLRWLTDPVSKHKIQWAVFFADCELKRFNTPELAQKYLQWTKKWELYT